MNSVDGKGFSEALIIACSSAIALHIRMIDVVLPGDECH